jgi:hypothetical protein
MGWVVYSVTYRKCLLTCDVTPYDRLKRYDLRFLDEDGAAL